MTRPAICRTPFAHESGVGGAFAGSGEGARGQPPGRRSRTARPPGTPSDLGAPPRVPEACASGCPERGSPPLGGTHRDERAPEVRRHATRDETTRRLASIAAASGGLPTGGGEAIAFSWRGASGRYSRKRNILRSHDCPGNRVRYALGQWSRSRRRRAHSPPGDLRARYRVVAVRPKPAICPRRTTIRSAQVRSLRCITEDSVTHRCQTPPNSTTRRRTPITLS